MQTQARKQRPVSETADIVGGVPSTKSIVAPHAEYVAELRRRVERGLGSAAIAREAGMSRATLWKMFKDPSTSTVEVAERVRAAIMSLEPNGDAIPPVVVAVRDERQHRWIAAGETLRDADAAAFDKALAEAETAAAKRGKRR